MKSKHLFFLIVAIMFSLFIATSCAEERAKEQADSPDEEEVAMEADTAEEENRIYGEISETASALENEMEIEDVGTFSFNPQEVQTVRDDIFREGYFSIFDVLVHLDENGQIELDYYFDEDMNTYVITEMNGHTEWWYDAFYDGGWRERSVFRIDHYPYKDEMFLRIVHSTEEYIASVYKIYREEEERKRENDGTIIVPEVIIEGQNETLVFEDFEVKAHNLRSDMFQPGVVTAIDTILSLADEGHISYDLQWYESLGTAGVVKSYWVNRINDDESEGRCGFVYEAGDEVFYFFRGNHNHIPSDIRVINSPQYVKYFWICI